jgi:hypothetical protein
MGADVTHEFGGTGAIDLDHHMQPLRLSLEAINQASKLVPQDAWKKHGIVRWLQAAAEHYFKHMPSDQLTLIMLPSPLRFTFEFDADGPVLVSVKIG